MSRLRLYSPIMDSARELLKCVDFGEDVAENERRLGQYFVNTAAFEDVVDDRVDLITGPKGSGKTAIFRLLSDSNLFTSGELSDVDIVPAFNVQGAVIFRRLAADLPADDTMLRWMWSQYIVGLGASHVINTYSQDADTGRLRALLGEAEIPLVEDGRGLLRSLIGSIQNSFQRVSVNTETPGAGILPTVGASVEFEKAAPSQRSEPDLDDLMAELHAVTSSLGRRVWVMFDRLDEAFVHEPDFERVALRALLRSHLDLSSYGASVRSKLFLRSDVLDRVTKNVGFVNATHLRTISLDWRESDIARLLARRIQESDTRVTDHFAELAGEDRERSVLYSVIAPNIEGDTDTLRWITQRTMDGHSEPSPRNALTLARIARRRQLDLFGNTDRNVKSGQSLIGHRALHDGFAELSRARLEDTLFAEFNHLRPIIDKFRGLAFEYSRDELEAEANFALSPATIEELAYAGFFRSASGDRYVVPLLYRPALELTHRHLLDARVLPLDRQARLLLEDLCRVVSRNVFSDGEARLLPPLSSRFRAYAHEMLLLTDGLQTVSVGDGSCRRIAVRPSSAAPADEDEHQYEFSTFTEVEWELTRLNLVELFAGNSEVVLLAPLSDEERAGVAQWGEADLRAIVETEFVDSPYGPGLLLRYLGTSRTETGARRRKRRRGRRSRRARELLPSEVPAAQESDDSTLRQREANATIHKAVRKNMSEWMLVNGVPEVASDALTQFLAMYSKDDLGRGLLYAPGLPVSSLGNFIHQTYPGFRPSDQGFTKFVDLVARAIEDGPDIAGALEVRLDPDLLPRVFVVDAGGFQGG